MSSKIIENLVSTWNRCGLVEGDLVLVHSSLKILLNKLKDKFGESVKPQTIYDSLIETITPKGTLIVPLYNFDFPISKFFDINKTPSQMGILTEILRGEEQSIRTGHPIYSFGVIGMLSNEFKNINNYSGYGNDSPFAKIKNLNGKIAVIGLDDQSSMTSYHFVEEQKLVDYRYYKDFKGDYIDETGDTSSRTYSLYVRDIDRGVETDVNRMMDYLWKIGAYNGDRHNEGFGMRTIKFNDLYKETENIINSGKAIDYLYSIKK